jgi:hypothetical protein
VQSTGVRPRATCGGRRCRSQSRRRYPGAMGPADESRGLGEDERASDIASRPGFDSRVGPGRGDRVGPGVGAVRPGHEGSPRRWVRPPNSTAQHRHRRRRPGVRTPLAAALSSPRTSPPSGRGGGGPRPIDDRPMPSRSGRRIASPRDEVGSPDCISPRCSLSVSRSRRRRGSTGLVGDGVHAAHVMPGAMGRPRSAGDPDRRHAPG